MATVRNRVQDHVQANPGVHFSALKEELDIATGQAQYHLRKLDRAGDIVTEEIRGQTHYFDQSYDPWERRVLAFARRETARALLAHLLEDGPLGAAELADRLELSRSTVAWHVSSLADAGIVEKSYGARGRVVVELVRPAETRRLLGDVTPSLTDRLVDRFTRLVDEGLADGD